MDGELDRLYRQIAKNIGNLNHGKGQPVDTAPAQCVYEATREINGEKCE